MEFLLLFWVFFKVGLFTVGGGLAAIPLLQEEVLGENQVLFQKGDFGNKMYFIKSGKIKISRHS